MLNEWLMIWKEEILFNLQELSQHSHAVLQIGVISLKVSGKPRRGSRRVLQNRNVEYYRYITCLVNQISRHNCTTLLYMIVVPGLGRFAMLAIPVFQNISLVLNFLLRVIHTHLSETSSPSSYPNSQDTAKQHEICDFRGSGLLSDDTVSLVGGY